MTKKPAKSAVKPPMRAGGASVAGDKGALAAVAEDGIRRIAFRKLLKSDGVQEAIRSLLQACVVPGTGAIKYEDIANEINTTDYKERFTMVDPANLENFTNGQTQDPTDENHLFEYARWLHIQWSKKRQIWKRKLVANTAANLHIDLMPLIDAAIVAKTIAQVESSMKAVGEVHTDRLFYANFITNFSYSPEATNLFVENVIQGEGDDRTASFFMYRHTLKKQRVYRSRYTMRARKDEVLTAQRKGEPTFICDFKAVGKGHSSAVHSSGIIVVQRTALYLFGNLRGNGIHVAAIPTSMFQVPADDMHGVAISMDLGSAESMPVAGRIWMSRDTSNAPYDDASLTGAATETDAVRDYFSGDQRPLGRISNNTELTFKKPLKASDGTVFEDYQDLVRYYGPLIREALKGKVEGFDSGMLENLFLLANLRGSTALSVGKRGSE
jgi:hypothetical protein